ncbi:MAG TPA: LarC family nickel insertion protein [bacterium]|nr:LarC family nickel insertion protein [bacterium]HQL60847.1 LarC family nickel insertion protein [bacterium]
MPISGIFGTLVRPCFFPYAHIADRLKTVKIAYLETFYGLSARMLLGALVDQGVSADDLESLLRSSAIPDLRMEYRRVEKHGIAAMRVFLNMPEREKLSDSALGNLPEPVRTPVIQALKDLVEAEAISSGKTVSAVPLSNRMIAEIAAVVAAFYLSGIERLLVSEVRTGHSDGLELVPGPAVTRLLQGFRIAAGPYRGNLVTVDGAAPVKTLAEPCERMPSLELTGVGVGAGDLEDVGFPNILRVFVGTADSETSDEVTVIETQIDDMSPELFGVLMEDAFRAGALDVMFTPVYMKKNRPGTLVTVLAPAGREEDLAQLALRESTTVGVRMHRVERRILRRKEVTVQTSFGTVRGKAVWGAGVERRFKPEYEDCLRIHRETGKPLLEILAAAQRAYESSNADSGE